MTTPHESHPPDPDEELLRAVLAEEEAALTEEHGRRDPISPAARTRLRGGTAGAPAPPDRPSVEDVYGPVDRPSAGLPGDATADGSVTGAPGTASVPAAGEGSPEAFIGADAETPADVQARHRRAQEAPPGWHSWPSSCSSSPSHSPAEPPEPLISGAAPAAPSAPASAVAVRTPPRSTVTVPQPTLDALQVAAAAAAEKVATHIVAVDVAERLGLTDAFLIASGASERQVNAIVDGIEEDLLVKEQLKPLRREGRSDGHWVLLDYGHFVVHVQHREDREFYALDRLWKDSPAIDLGLPEEATRPDDALDAATQD